MARFRSKYFILVVSFITGLGNCFAQNHKIDSLRLVLRTEKDDTNRVNSLNALAFAFYPINPDTTILLIKQSIALSTALNWKRGEAIAYINGGIGYCVKGDFPNGLNYFLKALDINQQLGNKYGVASIYCNIGTIYDQQGDFPKALDYYTKALTIGRELGRKQLQANALGNIGIIYREQNKYPEALSSYQEAVAIDEETGDKNEMALQFGNIGNIYMYEHDYVRAVEYVLKSIAINKEAGDVSSLGYDYDDLGDICTKQKKYNNAKIYLDSALRIANKIGETYLKKETYSDLCRMDSAMGDFKAALEHYKSSIVCRDSLVNEANTKKTVQSQMNFEFQQKQAAEKAEQDKKDAIAEQDRNKQKVIRNSFIAGFALMLSLAFFIFRGYRQKQKANEIITQQKEEVEKQKTLVEQQKLIVDEKNKDILDSITYAKRLQDAILPPLSIIRQYLPESFVLYKPKDIVAGDFYWMEKVTSLNLSQGRDFERSQPGMPSPLREGQDEVILIAAADCTGHGVPGALVSVVCSNALNRAVKEFGITEPGKILDKVRELVLETFEKSEDSVQDGMDISLCCINTHTREIQWSGAYNSLWYIQGNARPDDPFGREIKEVPADKQPIGANDKPSPFNTHSLKLRKGDTLYLFTDGYADQFGGDKGKKFKYKQMEQLIMDNSHLTMEEQKNLLENKFEEWKGNLEQVDDVLIIGVRV